MASQAPARTRPIHQGLVLVLCSAAQFMVVLDVSIVNVALPVIKTALGFDDAGLQWVINAYTIAFAGFLLCGGRLADLFGRRAAFLLGIAVFTLASLIGGVAQEPVTLVAARVLQGLGAAVVAPATLTVLSTTFTEPAARARAFSVWGSVVGAGGALGALAGGTLTNWLSWRWILFINLPIGVVLVVLALRGVTDLPGRRRRRGLDLLGGLSVTAGVCAVVGGLVTSEPFGWGSPVTLGCFGAGVLLLAFFAYDQARLAAEPMLPLAVLRIRSVITANAVVFASGVALFGTFYFLTLSLQQVLHYTPLQAGLAYLPLAVALTVSARLSARLLPRLGPRLFLVGGLVLTVAGLLWLGFLTEESTFAGVILESTALLGIGQGMVMTAAAMAGTAAVPSDQAGMASGLINATRQFGGAIGLAVLVTVASEGSRAAVAAGAKPIAAQTAGYHLALAIAAAIIVLALGAAAFAPGRASTRR